MIRRITITIIASLFPAFARNGDIVSSDLQRLHEGPFTDTIALLMRDAARTNMPLEPLENKIREGLAKKRPASEILAAVRARKAKLERLRESDDGPFPKEYNKLLFAAERKDTPVPATALETGQGAGPGSVSVSSGKHPRPVSPLSVRTVKGKPTGGKHPVPREQTFNHEADDEVDAKKINGIEQKGAKPENPADKLLKEAETEMKKAEKAAEKAEKFAEKADKMAEKAMKKAEKKENSIEKRLEKKHHKHP